MSTVTTQANQTTLPGGPLVNVARVDDYGSILNLSIWVLSALATVLLGLPVWGKIRNSIGLWWDDYVLIGSWVSIADGMSSRRYGTATANLSPTEGLPHSFLHPPNHRHNPWFRTSRTRCRPQSHSHGAPHLRHRRFLPRHRRSMEQDLVCDNTTSADGWLDEKRNLVHLLVCQHCYCRQWSHPLGAVLASR